MQQDIRNLGNSKEKINIKVYIVILINRYWENLLEVLRIEIVKRIKLRK